MSEERAEYAVKVAPWSEIEAARDRGNPAGGAWVFAFLPNPPPPPWLFREALEDGYACLHRFTGLRLIASGSTELDGRRWLHVSISYPDRLPSYQDMADAKRDFLGTGRYAYQVFAPAAKHVNFHRYVLHLWSCLDAPDGLVLPDFTRGLGTV